jgi:penicillin-binding protein-related factor A (putative recombinase)
MLRNRGKRLERLLDFMHQLYRNRGEADITKKEVPTKFDRRTGQMVYLARTDFDFSGVVKGGRAIGLEAKETAGQTRLYVDPKGKSGLKVHQIEGLIRWGKLGAVSGVVWLSDWGEAYFLGHRFLSWFMKNIYDKPAKPGGKPVKSISLELVRRHCPSVMDNDLLDYLDIATKDEVDPGLCEGGQGVLK